MRYLIHDFAGHPFQVQLSRELALRGNDVIHVYPIGLAGPKGRLERSEADPQRLTIRGIPLSASFRKYSAFRRFYAHRQYARDLKSLISNERVDAVLSGNTPIDVQAELLWHCQRHGVRFVHWVQDVYCFALEFYLRRKLGPLARLVSFPFLKLEQSVARRSNASVVIASAFRDVLLEWGVPEKQIAVHENWAPLDELASFPRENEWSRKHSLYGKTVFLYSGTLGLKHRPDLLYNLAKSLDTTCEVVVVSQGVGREYLEKMPKLENLLLLDFQPYEALPQMLASADVLVATLETDAAEFAVPSKILTYLCAGRAILLAAPKVNLAASIIQRSGSGAVVDPDKTAELINAAKEFASNPELRRDLGASARRYAEKNFEISRIARFFESALSQTPAFSVLAEFSEPNIPTHV
jgi:colanic acid biosynthesis glycosyl transferase WcaI